MNLLSLLLDALTLFMLASFFLSAVVAALPRLKGQAAVQEREARRRLLLPPVGAAAIVAFGFWPHAWAALNHAPLDKWSHLTEASPGAMLHDLAVVLLLAGWMVITLWNAYHWGQARGHLQLLEQMAAPERGTPMRALLASAGLSWPGNLSVIHYDSAVCFVYGLRRQHLMISTGVVGGLSPERLQVVFSHELAHVERRDNVWRLIGQFALLSHLPRVGEHAFKRWALAAEMACDARAAERIGSSLQVADALMGFQRLVNERGASRIDGSMWAVAFEGTGDLEARIMMLLEPPLPSRAQGLLQPWPWILLLAAAWQAEILHQGLEVLLRLLHM